jgi:hypothetical protein
MSFIIDMNKWTKKANGNTKLVIRKIVLDLYVKLVQKSPVDSGRFRGNWQVGINYPYTTQSSRIDNQPFGSAPSSGIFTEADATTKRWEFNDNAIYLTNNLPYAYRLEMGYSRQAPQGIARISVMEIAGKYA